jgi:small GTP-binding protein
MESTDTFLLKIILLGDPSVGKTSLRKRFMGEGYSSNYLKTLGVDISHFKYELDNNTYLLSIWDMMGEDMYARVRQNYFMGAKGCFFVIDLTTPINEETFAKWLYDLKSSTLEDNFTITLLGNKSDLVDDIVIRQEDIENIQNRFKKELGYNNIEYFETSAKEGTNIAEAFKSQISSLINQYYEQLDKMKKLRDHTNFPLAVFFMNEFGPDLYYKDFTKLQGNDQEIVDDNLDSFLIQVSISLISSIGQGHSYIEGVFDLPAGDLSNYRLVVLSKRLFNRKATDARLQNGFAIFTFFVSKSYQKFLKKLATIEGRLLTIFNEENDINDLEGDKMIDIKKRIVDTIFETVI